MADQLINNKIGSEKQFLFLNKDRVVGVQSLSVTQNFGLSPVTHLGVGSSDVNYSPQQEQSVSFQISSYLLNEDFFLEYVTGTDLQNAYIFRDPSDISTSYSILSGYFNGYQCNYSIGNVPQVSTNFIAFQNAGNIATGTMTHDQVNDIEYISTGDHSFTELLVPYGNSITLNIDEFNTNRVQSFNIKLDTQKTPIYTMVRWKF